MHTSCLLYYLDKSSLSVLEGMRAGVCGEMTAAKSAVCRVVTCEDAMAVALPSRRRKKMSPRTQYFNFSV
ncbi:unnamed protein product [Urochloa humidicola]